MVCSSKVISTCALVLVYSVKQAIGDVIVVPALGIANGGVDVTEKDVQPFIGFDTPCGTIDVAKNLDTSTAVPANADGTFNITGVSFAVGVDGSTAVTAAVDTTGAGNKFSAGLQIQQNGNPVQAIAGTQQSLVGVLPPNTTCTGGQTKDLCLVQFMTAGGFSNCVVVSQGNGNNNNNNNNNNNTNVDNGNNNNNNTNVDNNNNNNNNNTNVDNGNNNNNNNTNVDNNNKNNNTNVDNGNNKNKNKNSNSNSGSKNVGSASKASSKDNSKGKSGMASAASSKSNSGAAKIGSAGMKGEAASKSAGAKVVPPPPAAGPGKGAEAAKPAKVGKPVAPKSRLSRIVI